MKSKKEKCRQTGQGGISMKRVFVMTMVLGFVLGSVAFAAVPEKMSYQGVLTNASGGVVPNGNYNLTLSLYDTLSGGSALWTEAQLVNVTNGIFNVILGSVVPIQIAFAKPLYLGVSVAGGQELSPRSLLTASPYSLNAPVIALGGSDATTALGTDWTNYAGDSLTLNCPGPGYVVVQSSVWMYYGHTAGEDVTFYLAHDTTATAMGPGWRYLSAYTLPASAPTLSSQDVELSVQTIFPFTSAGPHTFFLNGKLTGPSSSEVDFYYASNVATWYPATSPVLPASMALTGAKAKFLQNAK
jgi:hypothetical protein